MSSDGVSSNSLSHAHSSPCLTQYKYFQLPNPTPTPYGEITEKWCDALSQTVDASSRLKHGKQGYKAKDHEAEVSLDNILYWPDGWLTLSRQNCGQKNREW
jgi:hypothetical protein